MSFDDFEVHARREIQNYLDGTNRDSRYYEVQYHQVLKLEWTSKPDTSDEKLIMFSITLEKNLSTVHFSLQIDYTYGEDEDNFYTAGRTDLPHSEEEYFQMSTVHDLGFRWEFYQYLLSVFEQLRKRNGKET